MRVVDTSAWIEWLIESSTGKLVVPLLPERSNWVVPTIVQFELAKWFAREDGADRFGKVLAFMQFSLIVPLDTKIALAAVEYGHAHKLATSDAIIYATAREYDAELVTNDAHFEGLPGVLFVAKVKT